MELQKKEKPNKTFIEIIIHSVEEEHYFYYTIPAEEAGTMHGYEHCAEKY